VQPELLRPHDVTQRAVNAPEAALEILEVLLIGQLLDRVENAAVRPGVVVEQLEELVH